MNYCSFLEESGSCVRVYEKQLMFSYQAQLVVVYRTLVYNVPVLC